MGPRALRQMRNRHDMRPDFFGAKRTWPDFLFRPVGIIVFLFSGPPCDSHRPGSMSGSAHCRNEGRCFADEAIYAGSAWAFRG